jgi:hypothetical protein
MFFRKKTFVESNPKDLNTDGLLLLHASLLAKLLQLTEELRGRFDALASLNQALDEKFRDPADFAKEAKRMNGLYVILDNVLAQQIGKAPT